MSAGEELHFLRTIKLAKFALLAAVLHEVNYKPNLRHHCLSSAGLAAAILKHYSVPFRVIVGYTTFPGHSIATPHVWLYTPGMPPATDGSPCDGITDLAGTDCGQAMQQRQVPMLGQYMFHGPGTVKIEYHESHDGNPPEGFTAAQDSARSLAHLAHHAGNFNTYFFQAPVKIQQAKDKVLAYAFRMATEKMTASDQKDREHARGGASASTGAGPQQPQQPQQAQQPQQPPPTNTTTTSEPSAFKSPYPSE